MASDTVITIIGNLTGDPELRFSQNGVAVAGFTIASTPRQFDRQAGEWKEGETLFMRCSAWREMAENIAESLTKGARVMAQGKLQQRSWETKEGERRTGYELVVEEIGPSLKFATAQVTRNQRNNGTNGNPPQGNYTGGFPQGNTQPARNSAQPAADPWAAQSGGNYSWGSGADDEPPF